MFVYCFVIQGKINKEMTEYKLIKMSLNFLLLCNNYMENNTIYRKQILTFAFVWYLHQIPITKDILLISMELYKYKKSFDHINYTTNFLRKNF